MLILALKFILSLSGLLLLSEETSAVISVSALLTAMILTSLNQYFSSRFFTLISSMAYLGLCVFFPAFCLFLPLVCFDVLQSGQRKAAVLVLVPLIVNMFKWSAVDTGLLFLLTILAAFIQYMYEKINRLKVESKWIRDSGAEQNQLLSEKNQSLMEKQDYEIHLATLKERNRIAREIHDNVGHILSRSILQIGALQTLGGNEHLTEHLASLRNALSQAMDSIRGSVHDLRDESIDLYSSLSKMLDAETYEINLDYDVTQSVPNNIKYCFLTVLKEALTNIAKHSNATAIRIAVQEHPALYQLLIHDNGTQKIPSHGEGMGLNNMEERVAALGGRFSAAYQKGFRIFISIPKKEEIIN